jgi:hypothetical protein
MLKSPFLSAGDLCRAPETSRFYAREPSSLE